MKHCEWWDYNWILPIYQLVQDFFHPLNFRLPKSPKGTSLFLLWLNMGFSRVMRQLCCLWRIQTSPLVAWETEIGFLIPAQVLPSNVGPFLLTSHMAADGPRVQRSLVGSHVCWMNYPWSIEISTTNYILNWLMVWNMTFIFHILGIIIPTGFHIFQDG